jgi:hypothetical protein
MPTDFLKALFERAKNLLLKPAETWDAIALEEVEVQNLYKTWILPLAAIPPIATFIGLSIIGVGAFGISYRVPFADGLAYAVVSYALSLGSVYAFAYIVDALAPNFGAEKNFKQAFKVSAYFPVAAWIAGVFALIPSLTILSIVGLYSLYLLFIGLPKLMKPAEGKGGGYTLAAIGVAVVLYLVIWVVASSLIGGMGGGMLDARSATSRATVERLNRDAGARRDAVNRAARTGDIEDLFGAVLGGAATTGPVVQANALRDLPPDRLAGLRRQSVNVEQIEFPVRGVHVTAEYADGTDTMTLEITNSPVMSSMLAAFGLAAATYDNTTSDGYERMSRDGDSLVIEEWSESSQMGRYGRTIGQSFLIEASGRGVSMRDLERAVTSFSARDLERLPKQGG